MEWRESEGVRWLEAALPGATAAFPDRSAGSLKQGHRHLAAALGIGPDRIVESRQVHGVDLAVHDSASKPATEADGQVIVEPGLAGLVGRRRPVRHV